MKQACAITRALNLDWTVAPFTRWLIHNASLRLATDEERQAGSRAIAQPSWTF
jgi:hypothetical protein